MADQNRPPSFPVGLAGVLNSPEDHRDSAYGSIGGSKHNSVQSASTALTPPLSGYQSSTDKTPSPINTCLPSHALHSPGGMSVASIISPTADIYTPRSINRDSGDPNSRRESVNSQLGHNMSDLRLANSPYASANQSTTSLQSSLQQQRNPHNAERTSGRFSNGYQPSAQRLPEPMSPKVSRTAPAITGPELGNIARAPEPTKGQAWAFPEEVVQRLPSAARPDSESVNRQGTSFLDSRRSSLAESIASSQFTTESGLPHGQRRLEDGMPPEYQRLSRASSELQGVTTSHHHHSLQHKTINDLQSDAGSPSSSTQPYSRTPELRVSHKLAERKRRTEMKDLFDNLRDMMPQERGSKASKWEILTKAIHEYSRLQDEIRKSNHALALTKQELDASRHENSTIRIENAQLREQNKNLLAQTGQQPIRHHVEPNASFPPPPPTSGYTSGSQLPPLRLENNMRDPNSMNGIQYHGDGAMTNGYEHRF